MSRGTVTQTIYLSRAQELVKILKESGIDADIEVLYNVNVKAPKDSRDWSVWFEAKKIVGRMRERAQQPE